MFELEGVPRREARAPLPISEIDVALTAQFVVAWAGESGEERRLGWWRSDMLSEFGGEDLFRRLLPATWRWAVFQAARETARRHDAELRKKEHDPDAVLSLFSFGFEVDERIEERLQDLKRSGQEPRQALRGLEVMDAGWNATRFFEWVGAHGSVETAVVPLGRRLKGVPPVSLEAQVRQLVAALAPRSEHYPLPHFRRGE